MLNKINKQKTIYGPAEIVTYYIFLEKIVFSFSELFALHLCTVLPLGNRTQGNCVSPKT